MQKSAIQYSEIARSEKFRGLMAAKKRFIIPTALFFFTFYFVLPILTSYTTVLTKPAFAGISWAWVYAFAQFIMTWVLCSVYTQRAAKFDDTAKEIVKEVTE